MLKKTNQHFLVALLLWSMLVFASMGYHFHSLWQATLHTAQTAAQATINKDLSYRNWANSHGGVYVPPTERTPSNPYLNVPNKDVMTTTGQALTLMNPAYMIREIQLYFGDQYGSKTVITSHNPLNPYNIPDEWETAALKQFEIKLDPVQELADINGEPHLRLMVPFIVGAQCMKCHAHQGYQIGDVRGGIATYMPMTSFLMNQTQRRFELSVTHALVWLIGLFGFAMAWRRQLKLEKANEEITQLALYDSLTELPNRHLIVQTLNAKQHESPRPVALLVMDIDNFKLLNDTLGHYFGDKLLHAFAQRIKELAKPDHFVGRLSGDEFVVLLNQPSRPIYQDQVKVITQSLVNALREPYQVDQCDYQITVSIGVAFWQSAEISASDLLKSAEMAMYQAKLSGRNTFRLFEQEMLSQVSARTWLEKDLRTALFDQHFKLYYQAQVSLDGDVIGAEALIRWQHPVRGLLAPNEFLAIAEETGLILPIGNWVLQAACQTLADWQKNPVLAPLSLSVNVSALQFYQADFVEQVNRVLQVSHAPSDKLKLELTESLFVKNIEQMMQKMHELKRLGVRFSLDDFGTGYSSLSYLKRLPLDQLKIDQSFVSDILTNSNGAAIAKIVIALANQLDLNVIAEGVETTDQQTRLAELGCIHYQGYLYSRPIPLEDFEKWVGST